MADSSVAITAGTGTPIRVLTGLGAGSADQQVITLADSAGNLLGTSAAPFPVVAPDVTTQAANLTMTATGNTVTVTGAGSGMVGVQITGTWTGTIAFEATTDGTTWFAVNGVASVSGSQVNTVTGNGQWRINSGGYASNRVRSTVAGTGTAVVTLLADPASTMVTMAEPLPAGTNNLGTVVQSPILAATATNTTAVGATPGAVGTIGHAAATITAAVTTSASFIAAPAAGLSIYITDVNVTNSGATASRVDLFISGGTVPIVSMYAPATTTPPGRSYRTPIRVGTATALQYQNSAASTSIYVQVTYYIAA